MNQEVKWDDTITSPIPPLRTRWVKGCTPVVVANGIRWEEETPENSFTGNSDRE